MRLPLIATMASVLATACSDETTPSLRRTAGQSGMLGSGTVTNFATVTATGTLTEIGAVLPMESVRTASGPAAVFLDLPAQAGAFRHISFYFEPEGHPPTPYQVPHFDLHFNLITNTERLTIDCANEPMPAAERIPTPYLIPGTGTGPDGTCEPAMGVHAIDPTSPELSMTNPQPFTRTLILGYHSGALAFVEPMVTRAYLQGHNDFSFAIPRPSVVGREVNWPSKFEGTYDSATDSYRLVLSGFTTLH